MKRIIVLFIVTIALVGCGAPQAIQQSEERVVVHFMDFEKYEKEGFFISSTPYMMEYRNIGEITIVITPQTGNFKVPSELNPNWYTIETKFETIDYGEVLDIAVNEAKAKGADALVNLRIEHSYTDRERYKITGLCIKRL